MRQMSGTSCTVPSGGGDLGGERLARLEVAREPADGDGLVALQAERLAHDVSPSNTSGTTPMPTRFERWMRSKLWAITARTPSRLVPLAAQSREEPVPYSLPAKNDERHAFRLVAHGGVVDRHLLARTA